MTSPDPTERPDGGRTQRGRDPAPDPRAARRVARPRRPGRRRRGASRHPTAASSRPSTPSCTGPDFRLAWSSAFDLGWKAAAVNLADIAAMGARPTALLVALAMPDDTRLSFVEGIADGLRAACDELAPGCAVEGGDLTVSDTLTIAVTALGVARRSRSGAAIGARAGRRRGDRGGAGSRRPRASACCSTRFTGCRRQPRPPIDGDSLTPAERGRSRVRSCVRRPPLRARPAWPRDAGATAMMDVSDGLVLDASRHGGGIRCLDPRSTARRSATTPPRRSPAARTTRCWRRSRPVSPLPDGFRAIGRVAARGEHAVLVDGRPHDGTRGMGPLPRLGLEDRMTMTRAFSLARAPKTRACPRPRSPDSSTALDADPARPHAHRRAPRARRRRVRAAAVRARHAARALLGEQELHLDRGRASRSTRADSRLDDRVDRPARRLGAAASVCPSRRAHACATC